MDKLITKKNNLNKALITLKDALDLVNNSLALDYPDIYGALCDSIIKRFTYTVYAFLLFLKNYLRRKIYNCDISNSSKIILHNALESNLINQYEFSILKQAIKDKKLVPLCFEDEVAQKVIKNIPLHYGIMRDVLDRCQ